MSIATKPKSFHPELNTPVTEIMTRSVHSIAIDDTVAQALRIMLDGINTLPVVDAMGKCVGMISRTDLTEPLFREDQELARYLETDGPPSTAFGTVLETCNEKLVRELMCDDLQVAEETTTVKQACELMTRHQIHHLPVVGQKQKVIGMVSSLDVIGLIAN